MTMAEISGRVIPRLISWRRYGCIPRTFKGRLLAALPLVAQPHRKRGCAGIDNVWKLAGAMHSVPCKFARTHLTNGW